MRSAQRVLRPLHRWIGLGVGALLLIQAITGLLWANQDTVGRLLHPPAHQAADAPPLPLDRVLQALSAYRPGALLDRIGYPRSPGDALTARLVGADGRLEIVTIDPGDGAILSSGPLIAYPEQLAERAHATLMLGPWGHWIVFGEGLALMTLAVSGLAQWWPGLPRLRSALSIPLKGPPLRRLRALHAAPGALAAAAFLVIGATGALMAAEAQVSALVRRIAPMAADVDMPSPRPSNAPPALTAQQALDRLSARFPNEPLSKVMAPDAAGRVIVAVFDHARLGQPMLVDAGAVDRTDGSLTVLVDGAHSLPGDAFVAWLAPVHSGRLFGSFRTLVASAGALALAAMVVTGTAGWIVRRRLTAGR